MEEDKRTIDPFSGNEIRRTDNGLKDGDREAPQYNRPMEPAEVVVLIAKAKDGEANG